MRLETNKKSGGKFSRLFWPLKCYNCGEVVTEGYMCEECLEKILPRTMTIDVPFKENPGGFTETVPVKVIALNAYSGGWKKSMEEFKFRSAYRMSSGFAWLSFLTLRELADIETYDIIGCVPMTEKKRRARGYNQAELIARSLSEEADIPYEPLLRKIKENRTQHNLSAEERRLNVIGVYGAGTEKLIENRKIILVDDIITTGATLRECCSVLLNAGAAEVLCLCPAYS